MKLKELVDAVVAELEAAGLSQSGASLSLAFTAKKGTDGAITCDFLDKSLLSRSKAEEIHRLEILLQEKRVSPRLKVRVGSPGGSFRDPELSGEGLDSPAIYRALRREADG